MANEKPTDDGRVVPLDLSIERRLILRHRIEIWRAGDREDLAESPDERWDPDRLRRIAVYERLIEALTRGKIELPDEEARAVLQEAADGFDEAEEWEETRAVHDAQRALLVLLGSDGGNEEAATPLESVTDRGALDGKTAWTTWDDDLAIESAVLQRVLDVFPARLTVEELIREMAGQAAEFGNRDAVERAARDLGGVGLLHRRDDFVTPTRAALRFHELLDH
jgi:hypothetical protein